MMYFNPLDCNCKNVIGGISQKQKLILTFTRKGYSYEDVKNAIKGVKEDEIC